MSSMLVRDLDLDVDLDIDLTTRLYSTHTYIVISISAL